MISNENDYGACRPVIILVHGTLPPFRLRQLLFLRKDIEWFEHGSFLRSSLEKTFTERDVVSFLWTGKLTQRARYEAAIRLSKEIDRYSQQRKTISIIAHSHGGNVAIQALEKSKANIDKLITMATPFIHTKPTSPELRISTFFVTAYAIPLLASLLLMAYNWFVCFFVISIECAIFFVLLVQVDLPAKLYQKYKMEILDIENSFSDLRLTKSISCGVYINEPDKILNDIYLWLPAFARRIALRLTNWRRLGMRNFSKYLYGFTMLSGILFLEGLAFLFVSGANYFLSLLVVFLISVTFAVFVIFAGIKMFDFIAFYFGILSEYKLAGLSITTHSLAETIIINSRTRNYPATVNSRKSAISPRLARDVSQSHGKITKSKKNDSRNNTEVKIINHKQIFCTKIVGNRFNFSMGRLNI